MKNAIIGYLKRFIYSSLAVVCYVLCAFVVLCGIIVCVSVSILMGVFLFLGAGALFWCGRVCWKYRIISFLSCAEANDQSCTSNNNTVDNSAARLTTVNDDYSSFLNDPRFEGIITDYSGYSGGSSSTETASPVSESGSNEDYYRYTSVAEQHKNINILKGFLFGINADGNISDKELLEMLFWYNKQSGILYNIPPLDSVYEVACLCLKRKAISAPQRAAILDAFDSVQPRRTYYDKSTSSIQFLTGIVYGMVADGAINECEALTLREWISSNRFLAGTFPYDDISSALFPVISHDQLHSVVGCLINFNHSLNLTKKNYALLCHNAKIYRFTTKVTRIDVPGRKFCFTGKSKSYALSHMKSLVQDHGGICTDSVSGQTDYLIYCSLPEASWAYPQYGRKVEEAIKLQRSGARVKIITETDFLRSISNITTNSNI